jgi:OOP family OmpA-OmpF porin
VETAKNKQLGTNEEVFMTSQKRLLTAIAGLALAVLLLTPAIGQAGKVMKKVDSFEILADLSGSMTDDWKNSECGKMEKFDAQHRLLVKINTALPDCDYNAAFRRFGFKFYIAGPDDWSRLEYGPAIYNKPEMGAAIMKMERTQGITPLGPAIKASDAELSMWPGTKALVVLSDFKRDPDFGDPISEARALREKYGLDIKIYTISFGFGDQELAVAKGVAQAGGGMYFNGCKVLQDQCAFDEMMQEIFYKVGCKDSDGDGVCDDVDQCPNTPPGAQVDERGCWIGAYESFFDFDKAVIKKQYLPAIQAAAQVLKQNPGLYVVIEGHTDSVGSDKYNYALGLRRAKAVRNALVRFGVKPARMKVKSYGETRPIASNETAEGRAKNRRVEISVWQPK